jgi:hypothetical protein
MKRAVTEPYPCDQVQETHRGDNITVFRGQSELIVYGEGSDWMIQYSRITNHCDGWRRWYAHRDDAEAKAREVARKPYGGRGGVDDECTKVPQKFA